MIYIGPLSLKSKYINSIDKRKHFEYIKLYENDILNYTANPNIYNNNKVFKKRLINIVENSPLLEEVYKVYNITNDSKFKYNEGDIYVKKYFTSTTVDPTFPLNGFHEFLIYDKNKNYNLRNAYNFCCLFEITLSNKKGLLIDEYSTYPFQSEILLSPDIYEIDSIENKKISLVNNPFLFNLDPSLLKVHDQEFINYRIDEYQKITTLSRNEIIYKIQEYQNKYKDSKILKYDTLLKYAKQSQFFTRNITVVKMHQLPYDQKINIEKIKF